MEIMTINLNFRFLFIFQLVANGLAMMSLRLATQRSATPVYFVISNRQRSALHTLNTHALIED